MLGDVAEATQEKARLVTDKGNLYTGSHKVEAAPGAQPMPQIKAYVSCSYGKPVKEASHIPIPILQLSCSWLTSL